VFLSFYVSMAFVLSFFSTFPTLFNVSIVETPQNVFCSFHISFSFLLFLLFQLFLKFLLSPLFDYILQFPLFLYPGVAFIITMVLTVSTVSIVSVSTAYIFIYSIR